jgi:hypothetical protein
VSQENHVDPTLGELIAAIGGKLDLLIEIVSACAKRSEATSARRLEADALIARRTRTLDSSAPSHS